MLPVLAIRGQCNIWRLHCGADWRYIMWNLHSQRHGGHVQTGAYFCFCLFTFQCTQIEIKKLAFIPQIIAIFTDEEIKTICVYYLWLHENKSKLSISPGKAVTTHSTLPLPRMAWDWNTSWWKRDDWHYCRCAEAAAAVWKPSHNCALQVRNFRLTTLKHDVHHQLEILYSLLHYGCVHSWF